MNNFMQTDENLCAALKKRVVQYKDAHPSMSSQQIAKRFDMPASSLNRIENGDIKNPSIDQVLKILRGTGNSEDLVSYLEEFYPQIAEAYKSIFSQVQHQNYIEPELEEYFTSKEFFLIMNLAYSKSGISRELISEKLGKNGLISVDKLILKNILIEKEGIISGGKGVSTLSMESLRKMLSLAIENHFKSDLIDSYGNYLSFRSVSACRVKVLPKVASIMKEAYSQIEDVLNDPENSGDDYLFMGMISDSLMDGESKGLVQ